MKFKRESTADPRTLTDAGTIFSLGSWGWGEWDLPGWCQQELRLQRRGRQGRTGLFCHWKGREEICGEGRGPIGGEIGTKWNLAPGSHQRTVLRGDALCSGRILQGKILPHLLVTACPSSLQLPNLQEGHLHSQDLCELQLPCIRKSGKGQSFMCAKSKHPLLPQHSSATWDSQTS